MKTGDFVECIHDSTLRVNHSGVGRHGGLVDGPYWSCEFPVGSLALVMEMVLVGRAWDVRVLTPRGVGWTWEDTLRVVEET